MGINQVEQDLVNPRTNTIRPMVLGIESIQRIRIATGNRIAADFANKHGMLNNTPTSTRTEEEAEKEKIYKKILIELVNEYGRITDAIVSGDAEEAVVGIGKLPPQKKFQPTPLFSDYSQLCLVDQYVRAIDMENTNLRQIEQALKEYPIWTEYLEKVNGVGPKVAAVIISEFDPYKAKYVTGFYNYAGLDVVIIGEYTDKAGKVHQVSHHDILAYYEDATVDPTEPMYIDGNLVEFVSVGRSRKSFCQVDHHYIDKEGKESVRRGISFNPYLKTKLVGVLGASFLKGATTTMDGAKISKDARLALAIKMGFKTGKGKPSLATYKAADAFLNENGHKVVTTYSRFGEVYYKYRDRKNAINERLSDDKKLTPLHIHNQAMRYMIKEFVRELHIVWRHLEGLPNYEPYETAKLGYNHQRNQWLLDNFGIDTASFMPRLDLINQPGRMPPAIQAYIDSQAKLFKALATPEAF